MSVTLRTLFVQLRALLKLHEPRLIVAQDDDVKYLLSSHEMRASDGRRTAFAGVELHKAHVSLRLTPITLHPELLDELSPALKERMQGKAGFNFSRLDDSLAEDIAALLARGVALFEADGRLDPPRA